MSNCQAAPCASPGKGNRPVAPTMRQPRRPDTVWRCVLALVVVLAAGCAAVGPDYVTPHVAVPEAWQTALQAGVTAEASAPQRLAQWWTTFNDTELTALISRAITGNLDLKQAQARIREARARRRLSDADSFPTLEASGAVRTSRSSAEVGDGQRHERYTVGFDASWELDVFGHVRRSVEAAQAEIEASQADYRDVLVSLLAEVALNEVEVRTFQERLVVAEANLAAQQETH